MQINAFIYARYNSSRLPGKVLFEAGEQTVLGICVNKLKAIPNLNLIVATSDQRTDNPIVEWCDQNGILYFRGDLNNVAGRTIQCIKAYPCTAFFRVNADSPFLQSYLFDEALKIFNQNQEADLITNVFKRSFPYGIAVELINTRTFVDHVGDFNASEHEHITSFFYKNYYMFEIFNIEYEQNYSHMRWVLDTHEDWIRLNKLSAIYPNLYNFDLTQLIHVQEN